ncbi:MAG: hypothetical protein V4439_01360 [Patescibacteria group bacterium]
MKKTPPTKVSLDHLIDSLKFWEDINLNAQMLFLFNLMFNKDPDLRELEIFSVFSPPMIGSELTERGNLGRAIEGYTRLRTSLEKNGGIFDPYQFLPRVPTALREQISDRADFAELAGNDNTSTFPWFLHKWLETRKVMEVSHPEKIPLVDPCQKSFLDSMPYDHWMLTLSKPIASIPKSKEQEVVFYKNFIVCREGAFLRVLLIPEQVHNFLLRDDQRTLIKEMIKLVDKNKPDKVKISKMLDKVIPSLSEWLDRQYAFISFRINILSGKIFGVLKDEYDWLELDLMEVKREEKGKQDDESTLKAIAKDWNTHTLTFLINGIGKIIYDKSMEPPVEVKSPKRKKSWLVNLFSNWFSSPSSEVNTTNAIPQTMQVVHPSPPVNLEQEIVDDEVQAWHEVSRGTITFVSISRQKGIVVKTGAELDEPHVRKDHPRTLRDGRRIDVKQTIVRRDLHEKGIPLHGSKAKFN